MAILRSDFKYILEHYYVPTLFYYSSDTISFFCSIKCFWLTIFRTYIFNITIFPLDARGSRWEDLHRAWKTIDAASVRYGRRNYLRHSAAINMHATHGSRRAPMPFIVDYGSSHIQNIILWGGKSEKKKRNHVLTSVCPSCRQDGSETHPGWRRWWILTSRT